MRLPRNAQPGHLRKVRPGIARAWPRPYIHIYIYSELSNNLNISFDAQSAHSAIFHYFANIQRAQGLIGGPPRHFPSISKYIIFRINQFPNHIPFLVLQSSKFTIHLQNRLISIGMFTHIFICANFDSAFSIRIRSTKTYPQDSESQTLMGWIQNLKIILQTYLRIGKFDYRFRNTFSDFEI
jgi:hypothetical protein